MKVMLFGTFDILHKGHENLFKQALKYGNYLVVCLARDCTVKKVKGQKSFFTEKQRLNNLKKTGWVNLVVLGDKKDYYKIINKKKPDFICLGYDQKVFVNDLKKQIKKFKLNTKIIRLKPFNQKENKSSKIRAKLFKIL